MSDAAATGEIASEASTVGAISAPAPQVPATVTQTPEAEVVAENTDAKPQPRGKSGSVRPAVDVPAEVDGEPLSAMAMAFAMAGAPTDLVAETASVDEATGSLAPAESQADEGTAEGDDGSLVGAVAGAVAGQLGSVVEAVTSKVADVVEAVKAGDDETAEPSTGSEPPTESMAADEGGSQE